MNEDEKAKLVEYIEENLRASVKSGLKFIDPKNYIGRLKSKQNHVVFGRRGAGKSSLVSAVKSEKDYHFVYLNLEDYKDISFPNVIIKMLSESFKSIQYDLKSECRWWRPFSKSNKLYNSLNKIIEELDNLIENPDEEVEEVRVKTQDSVGTSIEANGAGAKSKVEGSYAKEKEVSRKLPKNKLDFLRINLTSYKYIFEGISEYYGGHTIFIALDDFYFIKKDIQVELIDYFHRLTKGTSLFFKVGTVKHRSFLYKQAYDSYLGIELGHDAMEIDLDYTLDNFEELQTFMKLLLESSAKSINYRKDIGDIFHGEGFKQLCLASGGVPRDFLSLFVKVLLRTDVVNGRKIGKIDVTEEAINNIGSKMSSFDLDSGEDKTILEKVLNEIKNWVYSQKRTNAFLVAKPDMELCLQCRQAIKELVDLRLLHLIENNTSAAPSDGRRYEAYMLDIGLYDNSRPRNFTQVEPGANLSKQEKDKIRALPRLPIGEFEDRI